MIIKKFPYVGVPQKIRIADWGVTGTVIHEIGHTVGLLHEQSRSDREKYINIFWDNIQKEDWNNYEIYKNSINSNDFDFNSIMLYPSFNGSAINIEKPTMTNKSTGEPFDAQRNYLSASDIAIVKKLYPSMNQSNTFTDSRDGHTYKTVKIGEQVWMAENLAYLPAVSPSSAGSNTEPYYYVYDYQGDNVANAKQNANYSTYGVLYNWPASMAGAASSGANPSKVQGVCPSGWHLPSNAELAKLENYLIANGYNYDGTTTGNEIAKSLAATTNWNTSSNSGAIGNNLSLNNKSGFSVLPGGYRVHLGHFNAVDYFGYWWSSTEATTTNAWYRRLAYAFSNIYQANNLSKEYGLSVRCVRD